MKILFVDDEPDLVPLIRQAFRAQIRDGQLALTFAADGTEALERLAEDPEIVIVVTDINMPRMDGLTLLGRLGDLDRRFKAIVMTAYGDMGNIRTAMNRGAFDFLTKPIDMDDLRTTLGNARAAADADAEAGRVRTAITRYLSDPIAGAVLAGPGAVAEGVRRDVSVLMSDLAGFSQIAGRLEPERVVELLNVYLAAMTDVVDAHGGAVDEFIGDAVLALFGAPVPAEDHAARAVACAVEMQRAMVGVNETLAARGLPALEMTVAVNSGEVIAGTIGSEKRAKYGVVGSPVNLTSRIQTLAAPGEVLVSEATRERAGEGVEVRETRTVSLKGFEEAIPVHSVAACGDARVPDDADTLRVLAERLPFTFAVLDGKRAVARGRTGEAVALSPLGARVRLDGPVEPRVDLRLVFALPAGSGQAVYAKVLAVEDAADGGVDGGVEARVRFSGVPPETAVALAGLPGLDR